MPPGTMPRYPQSLILATALVWSSSCTLEVRRALALALGVEWDSVTELQATLHMHLEQTGVDVVTETTLQSVQYLHLEPTEITWASSMSLIEIEELVEYLDLDPTVIDWETLTELIGIGLGQFATELGWDSATTLAAVRGLGLDPTGLDWGSSTGLAAVYAMPLASTAITWTPSTTLVALLGLSLSQAWAFGSSCTLLARLMLNLSPTALAFGSSCTVGWPTLSPATQSYTTAGSHTYNIPRNYRYIQLVGVGGGASGQTGHGGILAAGQGGKGGVWASVVLERGVDIPYSEMTLSITVGDGGAQPANSDHAASNPGAATTITSASAGTLTAAGGTGNNPNNQTGLGPGNHTLGGVTYTGGANTTASGNAVPGNAPGGGGRGGNGGILGSRTRGGVGAAGAAWARAIQ